MTARPVLYSFRRCPYAMRARLAIAVSGVECELREVVLRNKPQALLDVSPKATVPVVVDLDGRVIEQSLDIMLWALRHNDPQAWLAPDWLGPDRPASDRPASDRPAPDGQASDGPVPCAMLDLIAECDGPFKSRLDRYKYPQRYGQASGDGERDATAPWLRCLEARLAATSFLFGDRASMADMAVAPFIRQFAHTDRAWFDAQPWPHLQAWLDAWLAMPLFERVMRKYPVWQPGAPAVAFP